VSIYAHQLRLPTERRHLRREALTAAGAATVVAATLAWLGPAGSDMAAHAYQRALFIEHGFTLWNNYWYAGRYSFVTYSLLYYPLAALLGIRLLAVATLAVAALAFAVVTGREWGDAARWSSRTFAVVCGGLVVAGAFPFALGSALALLAIWALQRRARWRFALLAVLTLAASPLAFVLLALACLGCALAKRVDLRRAAVPAAALAAAAVAELVLWQVFPDDGRYPFSITDLLAVLAFGALGFALLWRVERARTLRMFLLVYAVASAGVYLVPSALGSNITRLQLFAIPFAVLVGSLRSWRPLPVCLAALALACAWNVKPFVRSFAQGIENDAARAAYWQPAIRYLRLHLTPSYRVEAVDTVGHWPAEYLPAAGIPLARGWFRQDDYPANAVLYGHLTRRSYLAWLRRMGVRYVVLTGVEPDYSARQEARLLESGRSGLRLVFHSGEVTIYEVPGPTGIVTGGPSRVLRFDQTKLVLRLEQPGRYRLAVRYSPYWAISSGCLLARRDGMIELLAPRAETITLSFHLDAGRALVALAGRTARSCDEDGRPPAGRPH
jgi:hypothetical protein